jgi:hypothetical protein
MAAAGHRPKWMMRTVRALRDIRLGMRELGLEPPELSPRLKWLGELENWHGTR